MRAATYGLIGVNDADTDTVTQVGVGEAVRDEQAEGVTVGEETETRLGALADTRVLMLESRPPAAARAPSIAAALTDMS